MRGSSSIVGVAGSGTARVRPLVALLFLCFSSSVLQLVLADGCYDCCREGRNCDEAFDGSRGTCCGRISDTYYCCPLSDVCAQNARDAICVVPGTNDVRTYAYAYTPGSSFASWILAPIIIGAVCCCAIAALMMWRRRKVQREMMANGGMAPVTVVSGDSYGNYQRRYSNDAPHLAPHALPMATYAQPPPGGSSVPTGVPQTYQDSGVYVGAPNRFTNSGAPAPVALPIANSVVDSSLPQARDDAGLRGEGQPQPYGNQPYGNAY